MKERLILRNQYWILAALNPDEARYYEQAATVIESGYTLDYKGLVEQFSEEISVESCREVRDILDMYRALGNARTEIGTLADLPADAFTFQGLDGNEEGGQYGYVTFLVEDQGRWAESNTGGLNSHMPMLDRYRRMLDEWQRSASKFDLNDADVRRIVV
jgi:uncharacterized protein YfbU (UPF0304 family)